MPDIDELLYSDTYGYETDTVKQQQSNFIEDIVESINNWLNTVIFEGTIAECRNMGVPQINGSTPVSLVASFTDVLLHTILKTGCYLVYSSEIVEAVYGLPVNKDGPYGDLFKTGDVSKLDIGSYKIIVTRRGALNIIAKVREHILQIIEQLKILKALVDTTTDMSSFLEGYKKVFDAITSAIAQYNKKELDKAAKLLENLRKELEACEKLKELETITDANLLMFSCQLKAGTGSYRKLIRDIQKEYKDDPVALVIFTALVSVPSIIANMLKLFGINVMVGNNPVGGWLRTFTGSTEDIEVFLTSDEVEAVIKALEELDKGLEAVIALSPQMSAYYVGATNLIDAVTQIPNEITKLTAEISKAISGESTESALTLGNTLYSLLKAYYEVAKTYIGIRGSIEEAIDVIVAPEEHFKEAQRQLQQQASLYPQVTDEIKKRTTASQSTDNPVKSIDFDATKTRLVLNR